MLFSILSIPPPPGGGVADYYIYTNQWQSLLCLVEVWQLALVPCSIPVCCGNAPHIYQKVPFNLYFIFYEYFMCIDYGRRIKAEEKAKVVACWLGDVLECRSNHLAARIIWPKVFGRTSILLGWWFGMVWTRWSSIFPSIYSAYSRYPIHPFLPFVQVENS